LPFADDVTASRTFLVVDDEPFVREVLGEILDVLGVEALLVSSGEEAIALLGSREAPLHGALVDVRMPGISGYTCVAALRRLRPGLACAVMSGLDAGEVSGALPDGVRWLSKPFTVAEVRALVGSLQAG